MRVRLGEALRYLRQPLRERARERDDMKRPFFQLLQVRKMRLEPALTRAHFLNPREKRGASCGVCPVHCPGRTSRALPPRDDSLLGRSPAGCTFCAATAAHSRSARASSWWRSSARRLSRDAMGIPKRPRAPAWRGSCRSSPPIRTPDSEKTCIWNTLFFNKIVYSRYTKFHHGLPRRLNEECGEKRSFDGVVARPNSMVISRSLVLPSKTNRCNND